MDLSSLLSYILLCLALASECHMLDVSVLLYPAAMRLVHISLCTFILTIFSYLISFTHYIFVLTHYIVVCADLTPAMCFTICAVWALSYITGAVHYCADVTLSVYTRMKKLMLRAMKSWKKYSRSHMSACLSLVLYPWRLTQLS